MDQRKYMRIREYLRNFEGDKLNVVRQLGLDPNEWLYRQLLNRYDPERLARQQMLWRMVARPV